MQNFDALTATYGAMLQRLQQTQSQSPFATSLMAKPMAAVNTESLLTGRGSSDDVFARLQQLA